MLDMKENKEIIDSFFTQLIGVKDEMTNIKLATDKWSLREIIGHLNDSASNNHQRFVRLQVEDGLNFPSYDAEEWLRIQNHNSTKWDVLITLWHNYNCLLLNVIKNIDETAYGNVWVKDEEVIPLEQLIFEYYKHITLHIEHFNNRLEELSMLSS